MVMYNVSSDNSSSDSLYWLEIVKKGVWDNVSTTDGYLVTSNGEVKISVNEEDLEV